MIIYMELIEIKFHKRKLMIYYFKINFLLKY